MPVSRFWLAELTGVVLGALALLLIGWLAGRPGLVLLLGLVAYLGWHLLHVWRLYRWLNHGRKLAPPHARGIWGHIFDDIFRLQQRNRERKRKLAALLDRFRQSAAAMPDATVVIDADWQIEWINDAACDALGLRPPQDIGQRIDNLVRHPDFAAWLHGNDFSHGIEIPSPEDKRRILSLNIVPYGRQQRLLIARDVTRIRDLEQMRRDFISNVSHELRTPLTVVVGFLETMHDGDDECARKWARELELMQQQATRMQRLVEDIMLLSRLESGSEALQEEVAVPALLSAIHEDARLLSGPAGHSIRFDVDARLWLRGNGEELRSAFSNLVFNAVKYTPAGGEIVVRWARDEAGAPLFSVRDSGIGIAAHHIPRLTERFYRIDVARSRETGGTGLGLAIVKHVLNRHDARLEIVSQPGEGSTFICRFPATLALDAPLHTE